MSSFYGGRQGASFIISKVYTSIDEMVTDFKAENCSVRFEEYVIINTINKSHEDNGKVYKRGYETSSSLGGAIFICTLVGPPGESPELNMDTYKNITDLINQKKKETGVIVKQTSGDYTITSESLVPGKTDAGDYNDSIKFISASIRDANTNELTQCYIGLKIPFPVFDFKVIQDTNIEEAKAERVNSIVDHPFYEQWKITMPGVKAKNVIRISDVDPGDSLSVGGIWFVLED